MKVLPHPTPHTPSLFSDDVKSQSCYPSSLKILHSIERYIAEADRFLKRSRGDFFQQPQHSIVKSHKFNLSLIGKFLTIDIEVIINSALPEILSRGEWPFALTNNSCVLKIIEIGIRGCLNCIDL